MSDKFKYLLTEKVAHVDAPGDTFTVIRRCPSLRVDARLDADLPEGENRFYMLQTDKPLLGYSTVGPVQEAELSLAVV